MPVSFFFTRNFGKEAAIYAGLTHAKGDYVGLMDVDLQDPPKFLGEMYRTLETGEYDCVAARRTDRAGERRIRSFFSAMFYKVINKISKIEFVEGLKRLPADDPEDERCCVKDG